MKTKRNLDFVGNLKKFVIVSAVLLLVGIVCTAVFGPVLDINFAGGTKISYSYTGTLDTDKVAKLAGDTVGKKVSADITSGVSDSSHKLVISLSDNEALDSSTIDSLAKALKEGYADNKIEQIEVNSVSPTVGAVFFIKCLVAVVIACLLVIIYVAIRFRKIGGVSAAIAALIALLHDVLLAFFAAVILRLNIDSNFIAVVMTLLGYSLNDTIVVFDRVRENRRHYGQSKSIAEITNISNNQVLSRNIMTSLTTVIAIVTIMVVAEIKGLTSLRTLTIPLTVGLLSGTYSSVCISPGLWVKWQERKARKAAKD